MYPLHLEGGLWTGVIGISWELNRKADSQVPPQTYRVRLCTVTRTLGNARAWKISGPTEMEALWVIPPKG